MMSGEISPEDDYELNPDDVAAFKTIIGVPELEELRVLDAEEQRDRLNKYLMMNSMEFIMNTAFNVFGAALDVEQDALPEEDRTPVRMLQFYTHDQNYFYSVVRHPNDGTCGCGSRHLNDEDDDEPGEG